MSPLHRFVGLVVFARILAPCAVSGSGIERAIGVYPSLFQKGANQRQAGEFGLAIETFEKALGVAKLDNDLGERLDCTMNLAVLNWNIGNLSRSEEFFSNALALSRRLGIKSIAEKCSKALRVHELFRRARASLIKHNLKASIVEFKEAVDVGRASGMPELELSSLRQLSLSYLDVDMMDDYRDLTEHALIIARQVKHRSEEGKCLNNLGVYYFRTNRYARALALYSESLEIARGPFGNATDLADRLNNIAIIYSYLGNYAKAQRCMNEALAFDQKVNDPANMLIDLMNMGTFLRKKGEENNSRIDIQLSLDYYSKCLDLAKQSGRKDSLAKLLNNLGLASASLGRYTTALGYFHSALSDVWAFAQTDDEGMILCNIGHTYLQMGDLAQARQTFLKAIELAVKANHDDVLWETYFGLGKCLESEGELASAITCYKKSVQSIDVIRRQLSRDDQRTGFARDKWKVYESWVDAMFQLRQAEPRSVSDTEIWETIEKAKAQAFVEELLQAETPRRRSVHPQPSDEQRKLNRRISQTVLSLAEPGLSKEERKSLLDRLSNDEDEFAAVKSRSDPPTPGPTIFAVDDTTLERVRRCVLNSHSAVLEFFLGEKRSYEVLISSSRLTVRVLPSRAEIEDSLRAYLKLLSTPPQGEFSGTAAARRIYRDLISPLENNLPTPLDSLIIIPDGVLCYLPFETLVRGGSEKEPGRFLIETCQVSYAPSLSALDLLVRPRSNGTALKILAMGNPVYTRRTDSPSSPGKEHADVLREVYLGNGFDFSELPYSKKEVLQIARIFPRKSVDVYVGAAAKEERVKNLPLTDYGVIHFACHGFLDESAPQRSALVLSLSDNLDEDGFLQAREIYDLRLNADLVVLSACQTGRGRLENGEGVLGLPRMFFYAGAKATLSSLWRISDRSTSALMKALYRSLAAGATKAQALRQAKIELLNSRFSHPFYWAGFVLNGDSRSPLTAVPVSR